jgi:hypothetical protein
MNVMKKTMFLLFLFAVMAHGNYASAQVVDSTSIIVPLGGNSWLNKSSQAKLDEKGLTNWAAVTDTISTYVQVAAAGELNIALRLQLPDGYSKIRLMVGETILTKTITKSDTEIVNFGRIEIKSPGYLQIKLQGQSKSASVYANVHDMVLSGPAIAKGAAYVMNNKGDYFYWGRRGPSVHISYQLPAAAKNKVEWFYNEVTVPTGNDVIGTFFMTDGFTVGYFGMQVNSPVERRILFSVWSPVNTDDPKSIPDSLSVKLLKKGANVHGGEFGGEGSGGQSYLNYPWVAGKTYAFLVHAQADSVARTTIFTAYFRPADQQKWMLIASFKRPRTGTYIQGEHSFLENFDPEMGNITRKVFYGNGWVADTAGNWYPLEDATFTGDATAYINYRKDYSGGVTENRFFLRNCGFFNDFTKLNSHFTRAASGKPHPKIDLQALP